MINIIVIVLIFIIVVAIIMSDVRSINIGDNMNKITINGTTYAVNGKNIKVTNGAVMVDGIMVTSGLSGNVGIKFSGDLARLEAASAEVHGNINGDVDCTNLICNNIQGDVDATNVTVRGSIHGSVDATHITSKDK